LAIAASLENSGFPFAAMRKADSNAAISEAIERGKYGFKFLIAKKA
jgi:hypothetical protein